MTETEQKCISRNEVRVCHVELVVFGFQMHSFIRWSRRSAPTSDLTTAPSLDETFAAREPESTAKIIQSTRPRSKERMLSREERLSSGMRPSMMP